LGTFQAAQFWRMKGSEEEGVSFRKAVLNGNWSEAKLSEDTTKLTSDGDQANFATFKSGTLESSGSRSSDSAPTAPPSGAPSSVGFSGPPPGEFSGPPSSSVEGGPAGMSSEHMSSFEPAYKIIALRDWLFEQTGV
jgi:hypothetical protein